MNRVRPWGVSKWRAGVGVLVLLLHASGASGDWTAWRPSPPARTDAALAYDSVNEALVLFGGFSHWPYNGYYYGDTWLLSESGWRQPLPGGGSPGGRVSMAVGTDPRRGRVVIFGGKRQGPWGDCWEWDGADWTPCANPPAALGPRHGATLAYDDARGLLVLFGGGNDVVFFNETWEYDGSRWTQGPAAPPALTPRVRHAAVYHEQRGRMVVFGGYDGRVLGDTWEYDGATWIQGPVAPPGLLPRQDHGMAYDVGRGVAVLMGGELGNYTTARDTWLLDAVGWGQADDLPAESRYAHGMAFDAKRGHVVAFGGFDSPGNQVSLDEAWQFDGTRWTSAPGCVPAAMSRRVAAALAYDERRERTVLFGGVFPGGPQADTWEFDGDVWRDGGPAPPSLAARMGHALAYDAARGVVVLAGGGDTHYSGPTGTYSDVWEYDGGWVRRTDMPATRSGHGMAYDRRRQRMIVFGGWAPGLRNDTWHYDGTSWQPGAAPPAGLAARFRHGMAYDERRDRTVLVGGEDGSGFLADVWEHDGTAWSPGLALPSGRAEHSLHYDPDQGLIVATGGACGVGCVLGHALRYDGTSWAGSGFPELYGHAVAYDRGSSRAISFGGAREYCCYGMESERTHWENQAYPARILTGGGLVASNPDLLQTHRPDGTTEVSTYAYGAGTFGVNVSSGDLDGALPDEIVTGPGPGPVHGPTVRAFTSDGTRIAKVNFFAYSTLRYGVNVAPEDIESDGFHELVSGAGPGTVFGPHVRAFDYDGVRVTAIAKASFFAYPTLKYGVNVSGADVDGDAADEVLTGTGPSAVFAPMVRAFRLVGAVTDVAKIRFWAFTALAYGVNVSGGDTDGDGFGEIAASPGPGGDPRFPARVRGFDYDAAAVAPIPGFDITAFPTLYGARPALANLRRPSAADLLVGPGPDPAARWSVEIYRHEPGVLVDMLPTFDADAVHGYGVNVSAGRFGPAAF